MEGAEGEGVEAGGAEGADDWVWKREWTSIFFLGAASVEGAGADEDEVAGGVAVEVGEVAAAEVATGEDEEGAAGATTPEGMLICR